MRFIKHLKYFIIDLLLKKKKNDFSSPKNENPVIYLLFVACGTNMGDHALVLAEEKYIRNVLGDDCQIVEITTDLVSSSIDELKKIIRSQDIIAFGAGGYLGDEYLEVYYPLKKLLRNFRANKMIILPQTVYFHSKYAERKIMRLIKACKNLSVFVREEVSRTIFEKYSINCILVPDMVFTENQIAHLGGTHDILSCLRNDVECAISFEMREGINKVLENFGNVVITDTVFANRFPLEEREKFLQNKLDDFSKAYLVITDRIHGMIFSYLTNTPCIVLGNYNHKVKSEYKWIEQVENIIFLDSFDPISFKETVEVILGKKNNTVKSMENYFLPLQKELLRLYE
jgi:pyruvyl transferase EpsI